MERVDEEKVRRRAESVAEDARCVQFLVKIGALNELYRL